MSSAPPREASPPASSSLESIGAAVRESIDWLAGDGIIAYPTETVWGLGACADRPRAIERLLDWKGRASDSPLAVLVTGSEMAESIGCAIEEPVRRLMSAFWPGPLMIVVPCRARFAPGVARSDGALGLRCSPHMLASALARAVAGAGLGPLTSTSLNRSGDPPARDVSQAIQLTGGRQAGDRSVSLEAPLLVSAAGYDAGGSRPSTVVDCTGRELAIVREGAVAREAVEEVWFR